MTRTTGHVAITPCARPVKLQCRQVQHLVQQRQTHRISKRSWTIRALADSGSTLDTILVSGVSLAIALEIGVSALPLISGAAKGKQRESTEDDDESDGIKWGTMTVISFIPLLNWLAWIFAAFEDPKRAPIYYTNAFVYLVPALSRGFKLDTFSVLCLLAGIAHVQVERIAQTDPEEIEELRWPPSSSMVKPVTKVKEALKETEEAHKAAVQESLEKRRKGLPSGESDAELEAMQERQLQEWDKKFASRQGDEQRKNQ